MTKQEMIEQLAKKAQLPQKQVRSVVENAINLIMERTKRGEKVTFTGFGTFEVVQRKASMRRNPRTGQRMQVAAKRVPKFRAGKQFKQTVRR